MNVLTELSVIPALKALAFMMVFLNTVIGFLYIVLLLVGVVPSLVYLTVAPAVALLSITVLEPVYVPGAMLDTGAATGIIT